jgi:ferredoxin
MGCRACLESCFVGAIRERLFSGVAQNPQEMVWIEHQAAVFFLIFLGLLSFWALREIYVSHVRSHMEGLMRRGMLFLFSSDDPSSESPPFGERHG